MWVVLVLVFGSLSPYGAFLMLVLCAPLLELFREVHWAWSTVVAIADAIGLKPGYIWPAIVLFVPGFFFLILAARKPRNPFYKHAAILLLGFLLAATISIYQLRGWAGV
jgi:hypothetical protein